MRFIIVGNGVAGITATRTLAEAGAEVKIYTQETHHSWYEERGIAAHLGAEVMDLDPAGRRILLADGRKVSYDRLLLAVGSRPFIPPIEGVERGGVFALRTIENAWPSRGGPRRRSGPWWWAAGCWDWRRLGL